MISKIEIMGRTVPSYRLASEWKKSKWKPFRERLDMSERKMFDEMMSISRLYNVAEVGSCKPVLLHPILMSIIFEHYKQLNKMNDQNFLVNFKKLFHLADTIKLVLIRKLNYKRQNKS